MKSIACFAAAALVMIGIATSASAHPHRNLPSAGSYGLPWWDADWENGAGYGDYDGEFLGSSIYVRSHCYNESQPGCFRIYPAPFR